MPTVKKKLIQTTTAVTLGCGSSCRTMNLSKIFHRKPNKHKRNRYYSDVHHHDSTLTTATLSPTPVKSSKAVQGFGWIGGNSLAVEKDSSDPYVDFKESMLQMIMEKEIYGKDDLRELLNCFLQLNSPYYHGIIVRAFTEIWSSLPS
ncbi:transcription repressor OFP6 [Cynara cardunculus var. scolymus]|uniref:Transcription repressor n=1 Tax=Cynara cardunculus var. scolymus TaxID=59895 RepID=A0A118K505_CYNCS|nr:transcription repressor OFP6 [Cynara cardunculus var. scolymus]KVI08338.1 Ovate protein family, C-terminal [Cynara cardunculus var. scolymus]